MHKASFFLRYLIPSRVYAFATKVRVPISLVDFRKMLIAKHALKEGGNAIDGGAHIGYHTRYLSEIVGEKGKVYSFEPNPFLFKLLKKYTKRRSNVVAFQEALGEKLGAAAFFITPFSLRQDSSLFEQGGRKKVQVKLRALDELHITNVRLIKLDVEGHEDAALLGAKLLLSRESPFVIFEYQNVASDNRYATVSFLNSLGYECYDIATLQQVDEAYTTKITDLVAFKGDEKAFLASLRFY